MRNDEQIHRLDQNPLKESMHNALPQMAQMRTSFSGPRPCQPQSGLTKQRAQTCSWRLSAAVSGAPLAAATATVSPPARQRYSPPRRTSTRRSAVATSSSGAGGPSVDTITVKAAAAAAAAVASDAAAQTASTPADAVEPVYPVLPAPAQAHFESDNTVFVEEFRIRGNEAGPDQRANIITIANLLQEVGGNHGVAMWGRSSTGFASMPGMDHLIFVATRMQIRMEAYPSWGDIVRLETYFAEDGRLTTRRDWRLTDVTTGRYLGAATSTWVTINTETRRPAKIPEDVKQRFRRLAPSPPRFAIAADQARKKLPEFVFPPQLTAPSQLGRRSDMDPNGHINNVAYLAWALEVIPEHTCQDCQLTEVEMDFKAECTAGDQIDCLGMPLAEEAGANGSKQQFLHLLRKGGTDVEVWRARTTWMPVSNSGRGGASTSTSSSSHADDGKAGAAAANGVLGNGTASSSSSSSSALNRPSSSNGKAPGAAASPVPATTSSNNNGNSSVQAAASSNGSDTPAQPAAASNGTSSNSSSTGGFFAAVAALFGGGSDVSSNNKS